MVQTYGPPRRAQPAVPHKLPAGLADRAVAREWPCDIKRLAEEVGTFERVRGDEQLGAAVRVCLRPRTLKNQVGYFLTVDGECDKFVYSSGLLFPSEIDIYACAIWVLLQGERV